MLRPSENASVFRPPAAVDNESVGDCRAAAAGGVGVKRGEVLRPVFENGVEPCPGGFEFVTAVEEVLPSGNGFQQQGFVGAGAGSGACGGRKDGFGGGEAVTAAGGFDGEVQVDGFVGVQTDNDAVGKRGEEAV